MPTNTRKSDLIALALGWSLKPAAGYVGGRAWFAPGSDVDQCWRPDYMTDDAAAIRDVLPKIGNAVNLYWTNASIAVVGYSDYVDGGEPFRGRGDTFAVAICEAYAASQGGWEALEEKYE